MSRFTASGDAAVPGSETVMLELNALSGADGSLYALSRGDGAVHAIRFSGG